MDWDDYELRIQVLSWAYEHSVKYGMDDLCFEIEGKFEGAGTHPEFHRGFAILVRRLQLLSWVGERTPSLENLESLGRLLEDMLRVPTFQQYHRFYAGLVQLYVTTKLLIFHERKLDYNAILKQFPLFDWEQIKKDFCLYDDSLKDSFKSLVDSSHGTIQRNFSRSQTALILNKDFLYKSTNFLLSKVPKLLLSLKKIFPKTALDRLATDEDHCRHLSENGVGAYQVLVRSLDHADGTRKFTRDSIKKIVRSLSLKRRWPPVVVTLDESSMSKSCLTNSSHPLTVTLEDSSMSKSRQSDSSQTPEVIHAEGRDTGPSNSLPRAKRMKSTEKNKGLRHSYGIPGSKKFPLVLVKRNFVYSDRVEWPKQEAAKLRTFSSQGGEDSKGNDERGGERKVSRSEKENRASADSRGLDSTVGKRKEDSSTNPRHCYSAQKSSEETPNIVVKDSNVKNATAPDFVFVNGRKWPYQKPRRFHPLKVLQGSDPKDPIARGDSEGVDNFNVLKKNLRNLDRERFARIPGASSNSIKIKVGSRETVIRNLNLRPLNFARYSGHCASEYLGKDVDLPEGVVGERELKNLISRVESVLEVLKGKLSKISASNIRERQGGTLSASDGEGRGTTLERTSGSAVLEQFLGQSSEQPKGRGTTLKRTFGSAVLEQSLGQSLEQSSEQPKERGTAILERTFNSAVSEKSSEKTSNHSSEQPTNTGTSSTESQVSFESAVLEQPSAKSSKQSSEQSTDVGTSSTKSQGKRSNVHQGTKTKPCRKSSAAQGQLSRVGSASSKGSVPETVPDNESTFLTVAESIDNTFMTAFT